MKEKNVFRRIGITGGIASGKSTVTAWLKTHGYPVWDADAIYKTLTAKGSPLLQQIAGRFGPQALTADGALHRSYLAERVFSDPVERKALDALTHPAVYQEMARQAAAWEEMQRANTTSTNRSELLFFDVPLLLETHEDATVLHLDHIWLVHTSPEVQIERLMARNLFSAEEAKRRIASQMPLAEKQALADVLINNDGNQQQLAKRIEECIEGEYRHV